MMSLEQVPARIVVEEQQRQALCHHYCYYPYRGCHHGFFFLIADYYVHLVLQVLHYHLSLTRLMLVLAPRWTVGEPRL